MNLEKIKILITEGESELSTADIHRKLENSPSLRTIKFDLEALQIKGRVKLVGKGKNAL